MNSWNWAVQQLRNGNRIRNKTWYSNPKAYWELNSSGRIVTDKGLPPSLSFNFDGDYWELYKEQLWLSDLKPGDIFELRCKGGDSSRFTFLSISEDARIALKYCYVMGNHLYHSYVDLEVEKVND